MDEKTNQANPPLRKPRRAGKTLVLALRLAITIGLLALLVRRVDLNAVGAQLAGANLLLVGAALVAALADRLLMIAKWLPLARAQVPDLPALPAARAYLAAGFAALFLPTSVGGDLVRALALGRRRQAVVEIGASIAVERLLGIISAGLWSLLAWTVARSVSVRMDLVSPWAFTSLAAATVAVLLLFANFASSGVNRWLRTRPAGLWGGLPRRFGTAFALYRDHTPTLGLVGLLTVAEQFFPIFVLWILCRALDNSVTLVMLLVTVPLTMFLSRLPIAIWSLGVAEGSLVYLLGLFGVAPAEALALGLASRVLDLASMGPGALFWTELAHSSTVGPARRDASSGARVGP